MTHDHPESAPRGRPGRTRDQWRSVRADLNRRRSELTARAAEAFPAHWRVAGTPLLARPEWIPGRPVPLERVRLVWTGETPATAVDGHSPALDPVRPLRDDGTPYASYAEAVGELARPRLFENRVCYRLLQVRGSDAPTLTFGRGHYFDVIDICEAAAHEFAAAAPAGADQAPDPARTPFRALIGDPTDLTRRPVMTGVSTLLLRHGPAHHAEFVLHWRDPAKVATAGGLHQVMPVGMFQPSHDALWNEANDFGLWRAVVRELSEELLGTSEDYGSDTAPIDYDGWPFHQALAEARGSGAAQVHWLGLGVDPLTFVTDMLTVLVLDAEVFDELFQDLAATNDEGHLVGVEDGTGRSMGVPFRADHIERFTTAEPMQPAGAALLRLAWLHRDALLGRA
ncbi:MULTISPECIES: XRE family transcriptional regulator [unclassified Streptomyces]|uniref:XRE family transcriptional regulator n=1 Tax=unclassified Streptomyces TaxID=2593676 RepID=UPI00336A56E0